MPAEIFIPSSSPQTKVDRVRAHGAAVTIVEGYFAEAYEALGARAAETGALVMHPFDQPEVIAGQGTLGIEIEEQVPDVDTVLMGVGGGGPLAGIAAWCGDRVRVVGVEPEGCASMTAALAAGEPVTVPVGGLAADSLGAARVGDHTFPIVRDRVERMVLVTEEQIREAQRALWEDVRLDRRAGGCRGLRRAPFRRLPGVVRRTRLRRALGWRTATRRRSRAEPSAGRPASRSSRSFVVVFQFRIVIC